jgi:multicomponent K+:H+ antiporter subunit F
MTGAHLALLAQDLAARAAIALAEGVENGEEVGVHAVTPAEQVAEKALFFVVELGIVAIALSLVLCLWRMLKGPTLIDRGLASDIFSLQIVGLAVLLTIRLRTLLFFDAVLIVSILGFVSTVAFAQFIGRRRAV